MRTVLAGLLTVLLGVGSVALSYDINANTQKAQAETKKLGKELKDLEDVMDDVSDAKSLERIEKDLEGIAKEADTTGKKVGTSLDDGFKKASKGADDFKQEASQTARESAASFDGSADSIQDVFQEVAANAFAGFGPAGAAAGVAAAAGIGVVAAALTEQQDKIAEIKENFADMYRSAAEEGRAYLSEAQIQAGVLDILFDPAKNEAALKKAQMLGADIITVARAESGERASIVALIDLAAQKAGELQGKSQESSGTTSVWAAAVQGLASDYQATLEMLNQNEEAAKLAAESAARGEEQTRDQIQRTKDAAQARYEAMAAQAANPIVIPMRVDTSSADNEIANLRARAARAININVAVQGRIVV